MASTEGKNGANGRPRLRRVCLHLFYWTVGNHKWCQTLSQVKHSHETNCPITKELQWSDSEVCFMHCNELSCQQSSASKHTLNHIVPLLLLNNKMTRPKLMQKMHFVLLNRAN